MPAVVPDCLHNALLLLGETLPQQGSSGAASLASLLILFLLRKSP